VAAFAAAHAAVAVPAAASDELAAAREKAALAALDPAQEEEALIAALGRIEAEFPESTLAAAKVGPLLHDGRGKVRRQAIRTLGLLPSRLDAAALADVARMLASSDPEEVADALRGLRWLYSEATIPLVLPLLVHADEHVKREACRTLAIVGDRSLAAKIEPLLKDPVADVREDAGAAVAQLGRKP
jgi:HEAT repeat protein